MLDAEVAGDTIMPEYDARVPSTFVKDPLSQFVQKLRVFIQHYKSPHISYLTAWDDPASQPLRTAIILQEDLLAFDEWGEKAMEYLAAADRGVDILEATEKYRTSVLKFYEWFQTKQNEIHAADLQEFRQKEGRLLRLLLEDKLDRCIATPDGRSCAERTLFFHVFLKADYEQLAGVPRTPDARSKKALELLASRMPTDAQLREKLETAYAQPAFSFYQEPKPEGAQASGDSDHTQDG